MVEWLLIGFEHWHLDLSLLSVAGTNGMRRWSADAGADRLDADVAHQLVCNVTSRRLGPTRAALQQQSAGLLHEVVWPWDVDGVDECLSFQFGAP